MGEGSVLDAYAALFEAYRECILFYGAAMEYGRVNLCVCLTLFQQQ